MGKAEPTSLSSRVSMMLEVDCNAYFNILEKRFFGMAAKPTVMPI